jgi:gas vesicle protein GvpL/GvpF
MTSLCIYAVCGRMTGPLACRGLGGELLGLVDGHGLCTVVGEWMPCTPTLGLLQRYDALQRTLADRLPAVLPVRFGTCVEDVAEAARVLGAREAELRAALEMVRGGVQMTLRTVERGGAGTKGEAVVPAPDRSGAAYLRSRALAAARESEVTALEPVLAAAKPWVRAQRVEKRGDVASVFHLVPRDRVDAYANAVLAAAASAHIEAALSGPFPNYAFTP